jgi:hypothetical protein
MVGKPLAADALAPAAMSAAAEAAAIAPLAANSHLKRFTTAPLA